MPFAIFFKFSLYEKKKALESYNLGGSLKILGFIYTNIYNLNIYYIWNTDIRKLLFFPLATVFQTYIMMKNNGYRSISGFHYIHRNTLYPEWKIIGFYRQHGVYILFRNLFKAKFTNIQFKWMQKNFWKFERKLF